MEYRTTYDSPLGLLTLACDGQALTGLWMEGQAYFGGGHSDWIADDGPPVFDLARAWLNKYFAGQRPNPHLLPLSPRGTAFQQKVWQRLLRIPYGATLSYGTLAKELGCGSARAVGSAVGRNPISVIIPCHRVVGTDGRLTGYAGGLERKRLLLRHEGVKMAK